MSSPDPRDLLPQPRPAAYSSPFTPRVHQVGDPRARSRPSGPELRRPPAPCCGGDHASHTRDGDVPDPAAAGLLQHGVGPEVSAGRDWVRGSSGCAPQRGLQLPW